jgi:leucine dehydrogenase
MEKLILDWDGEFVVTRYDRPTGTWMFVAVHSTAMGVSTGGTRLKSYPQPRDGLRDALRLAEGMTYKFAVIGFPRGGGKAVLAVPEGLVPADREGLLLRYAEWLHNLKGVFETGPDMGIKSTDMDTMARHYSGVFGRTTEAGGGGDPGPETALGVLSGIKASCKHYFGSSDFTNLTVLVQGVGSVGGVLVRMLLEAGFQVKFSDVEPQRIEKVRQELDLPFVEPEKVYGEPCDVFAPCATGAILNAESIPVLKCRIVAGAANNQLEKMEDGEALHERGILYAPDYVINGGGAIFLVAVETMGRTPEQARDSIRKIGDTLKEIYSRVDSQGISPAQAAHQMAVERVDKARDRE